MSEALDKMREIHKVFMTFDFSEENVTAARTVEEALSAIKDTGLEKMAFQICK